MNNRFIFLGGASTNIRHEALATLLIEHALITANPVVIVELHWGRRASPEYFEAGAQRLPIRLHDTQSQSVAVDIELGMARLWAMTRKDRDLVFLIELPELRKEDVQALIYQFIAARRHEFSAAIVCAYLMAPDRESTLALETAWQSELFQGADERFVILDRSHGKLTDFHWRRSRCRRRYLSEGLEELELPPMPDLTREVHRSYLQVLCGKGSMPGTIPGCRRGLYWWLAQGAVTTDRLLFGPPPVNDVIRA